MSIAPTVLPDYAPDIQLNQALARQDRIAIVLGDWDLVISDQEASALRSSLSGELFPPGMAPIHVLNVPSGPQDHRRSQFRVRSERGRRGGHLSVGQPAFAGHFDLWCRSRHAQGDMGYYPWRMRATLSLNPTTWVAHLGTAQTRIPVDEWGISPHRAFAQQIPDYHWERPLVPASNVVVGTPRHLGLMHPDRWPSVVQNYFRSVVAAFDTVIQTALSTAGITRPNGGSALALHPYIAIDETETYWEFWSPHPLQEMAQLEQQLRTLVAVSQVGWVPIQYEAGNTLPAIDAYYVGTDRNSPCLRIELGAETSLRIYAKTTSRLRFEVIHRKGDGQALFQQSTSNNHPDRGEARLAAWLAEAAGSATARVNVLLARMRENAPAVSHALQKRPHELTGDIYRALVDLPLSRTQPGDDAAPMRQRDRERLRSLDTAQDIVEQLVCNGRIALGPNDAQRPAVMQLTGRGILQRSGSEGTTHVYVVTSAYLSALQALQNP